MNRRLFLSTLGAAAAAPALHAERLPIRKGILASMLPQDAGGKPLSYAERFAIAKACGFQSIEGQTTTDAKEAEEIRLAAETTGLPVHSVMNMDHWRFPLSSDSPETVEQSLAGMRVSMRNAKLWGASTVLLVPGVVDAKTTYRQAWTRSQENIRKLLPLAEELKVIIALEEVWNKFLLSPLEFANYLDDFASPWVKAYFDVGNVVLYGYPQDWIRTLGPRIVKLHIKDFAFPQRKVAEWSPLREGEIDWKEIHHALADINYRGDATLEVNGGDEPYLRLISHRFDQILEGV